ncbi:putative membrane protein [Duganella sp. 1224]|uniref:bestrophin family protein n=1 Tax=Duganella sp. 1224 TaxID=2587052 RepID=UPI0015C8CC87|nr:bestrophin family ion channel [Duganella sp. 1224]NYE60668.1 putative membrane protein [Duganella sp. 1224]
MIIRPHTNWLRMLFVWNGSVLKTIVPQLLVILVISVVAVVTRGHIFGARVPLDTVPFPLMGVSLAIFLAFRNNAAYARYVEARQIWGRILIAARALTSQVVNYLPQDGDGFERKLFVQRLIAFVYALTHQLRKTDPAADLARYLPPEEARELSGMHYIPVALLDRLRLMLARAGRKRGDGEPLLWLLDAQVSELAAAVGGCERISGTPIPFAYGVLLHRTVYLYCFLLPFGLVADLGAATPLVCVFVAYTLLALEAIAQEIAEPFGTDPNCLALNAMTRNIERSLREQCGDPVPDALQPCDRYNIS